MDIEISGEYIKIGQLLKKMNVISSGGMAKTFLENNSVKINGKIIKRRSSKIRPGDTVWIGYNVYNILPKK